MSPNPQPARTLAEVDTILANTPSFETEEKVIKKRRVRVYKNLAPSARDFWLASQAFSDRDYIVYQHERITYGQAHARIQQLASLLRARGVRKGDRVAIAMRNLPEWIFAWWATQTLGAIGVAVNAWLSPSAFMHCLKLTTPKAIFVDEERANVLRPYVAALRHAGTKALWTVRSRSLEEWERLEDALKRWKGGQVPEVDIKPEDSATIFFTSGTTAQPKGVLSTQRQYLSNRWNSAAGTARAILRRGDELPLPDPNAPQRAVLLTVPLFHVIGNQSFLLLHTTIGAKIVLVHKFTPSTAASLIRSEGITTAGGVPHMVQDIIEEIDRSKEGWKGLKLEGFSYGGGPASARLPELARKRLSGKGQSGASQGYGLTEVNSVATGIVGEDYYARPASCGLPPPAVRLKIISPSAPQPAFAAAALSPGEVGEICIAGAGVAERYYGDEEATKEAFDEEGWFRSGDLGYLDEEGFLYLSDRAKDIVIRSGENISSVSVENAVFRHEAVKEVAVVSVPCEVHGEQVAAVVVLHPPSHPSRSFPTPSPSTLQSLVSHHLPRHCIPALIFFPEDYQETGLPRNATGKVLKGEVRKVAEVEWVRRGMGRRRGGSTKL
ncbi:hypothetical protein JCM11641_007175 [Rhodosporidiobolus odoratus]